MGAETAKMKRYRVLDGTALKLIAMFSMLLDHVGDVFFPGVMWLRMVGRITMPVFAFCIAEGFAHTRDRKKYLLRMGLFALFSEIPFDLCFDGKPGFGHQNIMLTFFLSILALMLFDRLCGERDPETGRYAVGKSVLGTLAVVAVAAAATLLRADYTFFAVIAVFLFYVLRDRDHVIRCAAGVAFLALTRTVGFYSATGLSVFPLVMYNGKKGKGLKWLFYGFYPGHLLVLYLLKAYLLK